jgi:PTS system nitrogen regulatory IIA component
MVSLNSSALPIQPRSQGWAHKNEGSAFLTPHSVLQKLRASTKKHVLSLLAKQASKCTLVPESEIFTRLLQRECLGSTGIGGGAAIPHARLTDFSAICGVFAQLEQPVAFESADGAPVDLIFLILTPEHAGADYLRAMARVARFFQDKERRSRLRAAHDASALYAILVEDFSSLDDSTDDLFACT